MKTTRVKSQKKVGDVKVTAGKQVIRFDVELTTDQFKRLDAVCSQCYRTRKNFAEALVMLAINSNNGLVDLTKLGVI